MNDGFLRLPHRVRDALLLGTLGHAGGRIWLACFAQAQGWDRPTTDRFATIPRLSAATGIADRTVRSELLRLIAVGALRIARDTGPGHPHREYVVVDDPALWSVTREARIPGGTDPGIATSPEAEVRGSPEARIRPAPEARIPGSPEAGIRAEREQEREQGERTKRETQQQRRPREGTVRYGPDPTTGDVELAARTLFSRMQRQEAGRPPKHPSAVDMERLALILTGPDAARAADVERACGAAGMGFRAFLLCWDDEGALVPDRIPSRKAPGERPEPEWAVRRRRLAEALERRREIYAEIDAAGGETVTPEQEVELNEISRLERLGA